MKTEFVPMKLRHRVVAALLTPFIGTPERGALVTAEDSGSASMRPAVRWPDGRVEVYEPPPEPEDDEERRDDLMKGVVDGLRDVLRCRVAGCTCCNPDACQDCPPCPHCRATEALSRLDANDAAREEEDD